MDRSPISAQIVRKSPTPGSGVIIQITLEREAYDHCSHPATHQVAEAVAHSCSRSTSVEWGTMLRSMVIMLRKAAKGFTLDGE